MQVLRWRIIKGDGDENDEQENKKKPSVAKTEKTLPGIHQIGKYLSETKLNTCALRSSIFF